MEDQKREIKVVKSYSLPPSQVAWLRKQALQESTPEQTISASAVLERIIDAAIQEADPSPTEKKRTAQDAREVVLAA